MGKAQKSMKGGGVELIVNLLTYSSGGVTLLATVKKAEMKTRKGRKRDGKCLILNLLGKHILVIPK